MKVWLLNKVVFTESLTGEDWSNLIEKLLPKHHDIYQKVHANLQLKVKFAARVVFK